jgi:hypothetical protein
MWWRRGAADLRKMRLGDEWVEYYGGFGSHDIVHI